MNIFKWKTISVILASLLLLAFTFQPVSAAVNKIWLFVDEEVEVEVETTPAELKTTARWFVLDDPTSQSTEAPVKTQSNDDNIYRFKADSAYLGKTVVFKATADAVGQSLEVNAKQDIARVIIADGHAGGKTFSLSCNATDVGGGKYRVDVREGEEALVKLLPEIDGVATDWTNLLSLTDPEGRIQDDLLKYTAPAYDTSAQATNTETTKLVVYGDRNHPDIPNVGDEIAVEYRILPEMKTLDFTLELIRAPDDGSVAVAQVEVKNANGIPLEGIAIDWGLSTGGVLRSEVTDLQTDSNGRARVVFSYAGTVSTIVLTATVNGVSKTLDVEFNTSRLVFAGFTMDKPSALANGTDTQTGTIKLKRSDGSPASGVLVSFRVTDSKYGGTSLLGDNPVITNENGEASMTVTSTESKVRSPFLTLRVQTGIISFGQYLNFVADPSTATLVDPLEAIPSGSGYEIYAQVVDANGNPVEGETVAWSISGAGTLFTPTIRYVTGRDGKAFAFARKSGGSMTVTCSYRGKSVSATYP